MALQTEDDVIIVWNKIGDYFSELRKRLRFIVIVVGIFTVLALVNYATTPREYIATALIGPPRSSMIDSYSPQNAGGLGGVSRMLGSFGGASNSPGTYDEYMQLLRSVRLAQALIDNDHILQRLYPTQWDAEHKRWKSGGLSFLAPIRAALGMPARSNNGPSVDALVGFLENRLSTDPVGGMAKSLLSSSASFNTVSLAYKDPQEAEALLTIILNEADRLIRDDLSKDVTARMVYLNNELPNVTVADHRQALSAILSSQEQQLMMLNADKHFSYNLVAPPHAPAMPVSPPRLPGYLLMAWGFAVFAAIVIVALSMWSERVVRLIDLVEFRTRRVNGN